MAIRALDAAIASDDPLRITPTLSTIRSDVDQNVIVLDYTKFPSEPRPRGPAVLKRGDVPVCH